MASMYSFFGSGFVPSYSAAKGALVQLTKSMAIELAPFNIQVNAIAPGWIETDLTAPLTTAASGSPPALLYQEIIRRTPAGRFGNPDECAGTAVFLSSRASDFVTGATICVDGGYSTPESRRVFERRLVPEEWLHSTKCVVYAFLAEP
jgi:2-dehydro-3-deoxy-D-gluconate 5-dehydrogenase